MRHTIIACFFNLLVLSVGQDGYSSLYKALVCPRESTYRGLFWSEKQISALKSGLLDSSTSIFKLSSFEERMRLSVSCGSSEESSSMSESISACGSDESVACCETVLEVIQPKTVIGVIDGITYNVSTSENGVQLLHVGTCAQEGLSCCLGGFCFQENRISWVLVDTGVFVPVEVPNHCVCIYL